MIMIMSKKAYDITGLNYRENEAAWGAINKLRGNSVKNAFIEGFDAGHEHALLVYRGCRPESSECAWKKSHAKKLQDENN